MKQEEIEAQIRAEEEAIRQAENEAKLKADEEARKQAEIEVMRNAEDANTRQAEIKSQQKVEDEEKIEVKEEVLKQAELEALQKELQAQEKAEEEAKEQAEIEARHQAELEAKQKAEEEAKLKAEDEANEQAKIEAELDTKQKAEEVAKIKTEDEAMEQAEIEAGHQAKLETKQKAEEVAKIKAEDEAMEQAEIEARQQAEIEAKQRAEEEAKLKPEDEAMKQAELEAAEEETKKQDEIAAQQEADADARNQAEFEGAFNQTEIDAQVKAKDGVCQNGEVDVADEKSQDHESGSISVNQEHSLGIDDQSVNLEISETLTNGTFNDEQSDKIKNSNVNMDTFVEELYSLVDQPIANDDDVESASNIIENFYDNNNREEEPKKEETKNVDIGEFIEKLDSLVDVEPPELVLEPVLMTELQIKQVSEMSSETFTNNTTPDQAFISTNGSFNDELISEKVVKNSDSVTEPAELGAEPFLEVPPVTIDELVLVNPSESLKLSEPAEQDVVDCSSSNENSRNVKGNFPTVSSSSLSNGLENTATKIKDDQFSIDTSSTMKKKRSQKIKYYPYHPKLVGTLQQPMKIGQYENNTYAKKTTSTCTLL